MALSTEIKLQDKMTGALNRITASLYTTISAMQTVDKVSEQAFNTAAISASAQEIYGYTQRIEQLEADLVDANRRLEDLTNETKEARKQADSLGNVFGKVRNAVAALGIGYLVKEQVSQAVNYASDLTEVQNVVDVVFGENSVIDEWSKNTLNAFGLSELSAKRFAGTMGAMLESSGMSGEAVEGMSMSLTELAGDMASFYNLDAEEAFTKIRSGISGETEPLKQLGINMSVANLEAYALTQGITKSYDAMSQAEQVALRYGYLMEATANAQGDFANTSDSYSNQVKLLKENWQAFIGQIATTVLPILANAMQHINVFIGNLQAYLPAIQQAIQNVIAKAQEIASFIQDNWSIIAPIIFGVVGALVAWKVATLLAQGAQLLFNAALWTCPLTWIVLGVAAVCAAIVAFINWLNKAQGTTISAVGVIAGIFATLGAHVINTFVVPLQNKIANLVNFFGNCFKDPLAAFQVLFADVVLTVLGYINNLAKGIETMLNKIPGVQVDITSGLDSFYSEIEKAQQKVKDESGWVEYVGKMDYVDYEGAYNKGYDFGQGMEDTMSNLFDMSSIAIDPESLPDPYKTGSDDLAVGLLDDINKGTWAMADKTDISNENLKYLRDSAEMEAINQFTTAEIKLDMVNNNSIASNMDIDGIVTQLSEGLREAMESAAEGVYA